MSKSSFDYAIVGLGAVGASVLYHLSKSGKTILGLDQFSPPHEMGSSHGESRITREAVGEGDEFIPFVQRSHQLWRELEAISGKSIMTTTGGLLFDTVGKGWSKHGAEGFFDRTVRFAKSAGIAHDLLSAQEVKARFAQFNLPEDGRAYYEPGAGFLRPELAIATQLQLAAQHQAIIKTHTQVQRLAPIPGGGVSMLTNQGTFEAGRVVISAGAWIKDFVPSFTHSNFKICRQVLHWLPLAKSTQDLANSPIFMWGFGEGPEDFIYGFPSLDGNTIKVASESFAESNHPNTLSRIVAPSEGTDFLEHKLGEKLNHVKSEVLKSKVCIYTVTPDSNFLIDALPDFEEVTVASACSGHGFKHSAGLGEAIAHQLLGIKGINLDSFKWKKSF
jgi:sarcosine oxidase